MVDRPARTPCRTVRPKSAERRNRCAAGSTVRQRARSGPCGDERPGSRGRRACSYAAGSRGSWHDAGCSAGRSACSRVTPRTLVNRRRVSRVRGRVGTRPCRARWARQRRPQRLVDVTCWRGHGSSRSRCDTGQRIRHTQAIHCSSTTRRLFIHTPPHPCGAQGSGAQRRGVAATRRIPTTCGQLCGSCRCMTNCGHATWREADA